MLAQALKVVEAARQLGANPGNIGIFRFTCEPRMLPVRIRELAESIETFDRSTGRGVDTEAKLVAALRYAGSKGLDLDDMLSALGLSEEDLKALAGEDLRPKPGEMGHPDDLQDVSVSRQAVRDGAAVLGKAIVTADRYRNDIDFPGEGPPSPEGVVAEDHPVDPLMEIDAPVPPPPRPEEAEPEQAPDGMPELKELESRIEALHSKYGWSEELKNADLMLRKAKGAMDVQETGGGVVYRISAEALRALVAVSMAIADLERGVEVDDEFAMPGLR